MSGCQDLLFGVLKSLLVFLSFGQTLRQLWRLLLRRAQVVHGRGKADDKEQACEEDTNRFLERGIIPLPLLDDVMGFNADEALRTRRQLQQQREVKYFWHWVLF